MMFSSALTLLIATGAMAINVTSGANNATFIVDTGADLVITIDTDNCDMTSIQYQDVEYQNQAAFSHLASGLGSDSSVDYETIGDTVVFTCTIANDEFDLTQYYIFRDGASTVFLATNTISNPSVGELRFLFRLEGLDGAYPTGNVSDTREGTVIESKDIYLFDGETRAKHYSAERWIDDQISCAFGDIYACFIKPVRAYEASTGGPFYRDIRLNLSPEDQGSTYYMNHGDFPWDTVRTGFHGPYIFTFAESLPDPSSTEFDYTFIEELGLAGYIGDSNRGTVVGTASGTSADLPIVVHWFNDDHQQWVYAADDGSFESPLLSPGTYTQAFYQDELLAGNMTVTVNAGATVTADIEASNPIITEARTKIFQIGDYDGRPSGLLNADKQQHMHVSDERMGAWDTAAFVIGENADDQFPMAIFRDVNDNRTIEFTLKSTLATTSTFRIGTTLAYLWGKPVIDINGYDCSADWVNPNGSTGRGITKGMTHGDMTVYECEVPIDVLILGTNTVTLGVYSSRDGTEWLSPNYIIDFIELYYL